MKPGSGLMPSVRIYLILVAFCLPAQTLSALAQVAATNSMWPVAPAQSQPWTAPKNIPAPLAASVEALFQSGLADPRGCDYREIEVAAGNVWKPSPVIVKTHGWILPAQPDHQTNFAIGWNGLVYRLVSIGAPANAENDAQKMIDANARYGLTNQIWSDEEYSLGITWLTPTKAAMILRFASPELAAHCASLFGTSDPFLLLATDRLWVAYDRAICAHMFGDDSMAYALLQAVNSARKTFASTAHLRGLSTEQSPEGILQKQISGKAPDSYFPFLDSLPVVLKDQQRRHEQKPLPDPATITNQTERITALIFQLENISGQDDYDLLKSPIVQALVREGWSAAPPLIDCFEYDDRLTRIVPVSRNGGGGAGGSREERKIVDVREPAYIALENILETGEFALERYAQETFEQKQERYRRAAQAMRQHWKKYDGLSRPERLFAILKEDRGQWVQAASILVQPTNQPVQLLHPSEVWTEVPWKTAMNFNENSKFYGASLKSKVNPSVTDLFTNRIRDLCQMNSRNGDDAATLTEACSLAFCLARWDLPAATNQAAILCALAFQKLSPTNDSSLVSHHTLSVQLSSLVVFRAKAGDSNSLREYVAWLIALHPQRYSWHIKDILQPLAEFPHDPAWNPVWKPIFAEENSPWNQLLWKYSCRETNDWSSHSFNVEEFFATPIINQPEFRTFVIRLLQETSPGGKIMGDQGGYWLDQELSTMRHLGFTVPTPYPATDLNGVSFRTCDFYAWLLANRIIGAPEFQLYWPPEKKDAAIASLETLLQEKGRLLETHAFQPP